MKGWSKKQLDCTGFILSTERSQEYSIRNYLKTIKKGDMQSQLLPFYLDLFAVVLFYVIVNPLENLVFSIEYLGIQILLSYS